MRTTLIAAIILLTSSIAQAQDKAYMKNLPYYVENLEVFEEGQEDGRAYHIPERNISLNGTWKSSSSLGSTQYAPRTPVNKYLDLAVVRHVLFGRTRQGRIRAGISQCPYCRRFGIHRCNGTRHLRHCKRTAT